MRDVLDSWAPRMLSVLRIVTGFLMMWHGTQKLFGFPPSQQSGGGGLSPLQMAGGILEFGGGLLFLLGFLTRPVAFLLSGTMAVAYWMFHGTNGKGFLPLQNGGELAALYCFVFLYFVFSGGGAWSLDNLLFGQNRTDNTFRENA